MKKRALIFRGGWDGHCPVETSDMIAAKLRAAGVEVDIKEGTSCLTELNLNDYQLIVPVVTMSKIEGPEEKALLAAIKNGVNCGGWHGGMCDSFRNNTEYQYMTGGQWVVHPGGVIDYTVLVDAVDHPIMKGIPQEFKMHSEQYYMHTDPGNIVLAKTIFNGAVDPWLNGTVMPCVWTRRYGKGKVFYSSLGHNFDDFKNTPEVSEIITRGLLWTLDML